MIHLEKVKEYDELLARIIQQWGKEVWNRPSPPKSQEERMVRHEKLVKTLIENNFSPESISLKHIDSIIEITVPIRNGSKNAQQMTGAAYWYLSTALKKKVQKSEPMANVILLRKNVA